MPIKTDAPTDWAVPAALLALLGIHPAHRTRAASAGWDMSGPMRPWYENPAGRPRPNPAALYPLIHARGPIRPKPLPAAHSGPGKRP